MGLCYSLRSRLAAAHPSVPYGGRGEADPAAAEQQQCGDPQVRHRLRQDLVAKERADKKRSKSIDKTLKAEKREYKQTHRLLLLGERGAGGGGARRRLPAGAGRPGPASRSAADAAPRPRAGRWAVAAGGRAGPGRAHVAAAPQRLEAPCGAGGALRGRGCGRGAGVAHAAGLPLRPFSRLSCRHREEGRRVTPVRSFCGEKA